MATIRKRNGNLYIDYYDEAGKRHRKALHLSNTRENYKKALIEKKKIEYELGAGIYKERAKRIKSREKTLKEGFLEFIASRKNPSPETIKDYEYAFKKVTDNFGDKRINKIRKEDIEDLENDLQLSITENSIASYFKKLKVIFNYFQKAGWIEENPIPSKQMKIEEPETIPRKDLEEILMKLKQRNREHFRVVALLLLTGLRISELLRLTFEDIDFRDNIMIIRNSKARRDDKFPLYKDLREFLIEEFPQRSGRLFNYKDRHSMKFFKKFLKAEGYDNYNFHNLRKTFISKLVNSGLSVYDVMTLARHRSIKTTLKHYTAAELSRMGEEVSQRANMGTFLGTHSKIPLKRLEYGKK